MYMKKIDELIASNAKLAELLGKKEKEPEKKSCHVVVWILAIVGAIAAIAAIAYGVYRYMNPEYLDDLDDFDDLDDEEETDADTESEAETSSEKEPETEE